MIRPQRIMEFKYSVIALVTIFFGGCAKPKFIIGKPISQEKVNSIQRGKTTKQEIIEWFGTPSGIVKKDEKMNLPKGKISSDPFFDLFSTRCDVTENSRIYYYTFARRKGYGGHLFVPIDNLISRYNINMLLILINENTSTVEGYLQDFVEN